MGNSKHLYKQGTAATTEQKNKQKKIARIMFVERITGSE